LTKGDNWTHSIEQNTDVDLNSYQEDSNQNTDIGRMKKEQ
jgi:hypothetical protein